MTRAAPPKPKLIAVDGIEASAVLAAAKAVLAASTPRAPEARGGISRWDASGIFQDLAVAADEAGVPSSRTLLLLYAADLAFRLRWQIRPALAEGRTVVVAPYVDTAMAFGRAAGMQAGWLTNLFKFAPHPLPQPAVAAGELRINPLYAVEADGEQLRLRLGFPSEDYEQEYGACRQYLPEELTLDRAAVASLNTGLVAGDLRDLVRRKVIVDLPKRYY